MRKITLADIYKAAKELRGQLNERGPILEFTMKGRDDDPDSLFSVSYSFRETKELDIDCFDTCAEEFIKVLNRILSKKVN